MNKKRLLIISRWMELPKGFSRILKDILSANILQQEYEIIQYAYSRPANLSPCLENGIMVYSDQGESKLFNIIDVIKPDAILAIGDVFNLRLYDNTLSCYTGKKIAYVFVDAEIIPSNWKNTLENYDIIVSATDFGKDELLNANYKNIEVINPPTNLSFFHKPEESIKKDVRKILGIKDNQFLLTNISINSPRKGINYTLDLLKILQSNVSDKYKLILNTQASIELKNTIANFNFDKDSVSIVDNLSENDLRNLYWATDINISTTLSEGWGLPITEALACATPSLAPWHSGCIGAIGAEIQENDLNFSCARYFSYGCLEQHYWMQNTEQSVKVQIPNINAIKSKILKYSSNNTFSEQFFKDAKEISQKRVVFLDKELIAIKWKTMIDNLCTPDLEKKWKVNKLNFIKA